MKLQDLLAEQSIPNKLSKFCDIRLDFPDADFWLIRKHSADKIGSPVKEYNPDYIGIKVTDTDVLDSKYLFYVMQWLYGQGYWRSKARGVTQLVGIKTEDVKNLLVSQQVSEGTLNEKLSVKDIHNLADFKCVNWDNDPKFMEKTKKLTGKSHLDDLTQAELKKVQSWLNSLPDKVDEKRDACYHKVKRRYKIWPSAYASGALVQCRKKGAKNWGKKSK